MKIASAIVSMFCAVLFAASAAAQAPPATGGRGGQPDGLHRPRGAPTEHPSTTSGRGGDPDVCFKPVTPDQDRGLCHGNWSPIDNTGKFNRNSQTGSDQFTHKNLPINRACQKCTAGGSLRVDYNGIEDHCVISGSPAQTSATACPSGSILTDVPGGADYCLKAAVAEPCHGNWLPTDNTGKYDRKTVGGPDSFWHKTDSNRNRTCQKCPNGGTLVQDYNSSVADMCVKPGGNYPVVCSAGGSVQVH